MWPQESNMDKIAGLKEILELDPKNSFARYGLAMELAGRGETAAALAEFDTLTANKDLIEEALFARRRDLFADWDMVFFDTTSIYFEGEGGETIGQRGHSKDHRPDLRSEEQRVGKECRSRRSPHHSKT